MNEETPSKAMEKPKVVGPKLSALPVIRRVGSECGDGSCGCGCGLPIVRP